MHIDTPQSCCRFALAYGDITPPADIYHLMWGAAKHDRATGIHQPLRATVILLAPAEGDERQFIIALDHCVPPSRCSRRWKATSNNLSSPLTTV